LIRQKIAACFSVFIRKTDPLFIENYNKSGETLDPLSEKVSPGIIDYLAPGEDVTFAAPPGVSGYNEYTRAILRAIAAGYGITYEALTGDLSNVNFSSGRMGWLEMHRQIESWQVHTVVPLFCEPIWKVFCEAAKMRGIVSKTAVAEWTPPRRLMLDPVKEANGLSLQIRAGLISRAEAVRQLGFDPDVLLAEMISEQAEQDAAGMMLESDAKHDPQRVNFGKEAYLASKAKPATPAK
jgi:lambda family phage portal protein